MTLSPRRYTIVFTDSGLGGLSIMADFYNIIKNRNVYATELNIIFFNALQESGNGYNSMTSVYEKVTTFNSAFETILKLYQPDKIAIACNTLSAIYPKTACALKQNSTLEIVSVGVSVIKEYLKQFPETPLFVLATPTTLASQVYKSENENVFYISGDNLASLIEFNYMMPELKQKVISMFREIKSFMAHKKELALFIGCTHYAYIINLFQEVAKETGLDIKSIIDPAKRFNDWLIDDIPSAKQETLKTKIFLKIESQAQILQEEIDSVSSMIKNKSTELTRLLKNYTRLARTF